MTDEATPGGSDAEPPRKRKPPRSRVLNEPSASRPPADELPTDGWYRALVRLLKEPMFALSNKHGAQRLDNGFPFEEKNRNFKLHVTTRDRDIGFAQILDGDVLIFAASKLVHAYDAAVKRGVAALNATIEFYPYELLAIMRRPEVKTKGGKTLKNLEDAFRRLTVTHVSLETGNFHTDREFPLLERYHRGGRPTADDPHPRWSLTVSPWFLEEIAARDLARVVWFNPTNFGLGSPDLEGGSSLEQLVARWAVGYRQYRPGKAVAIKLLRAYKLSGMRGKTKFLDSLEVVVKRNRLPDHILSYADTKRADGGDLMIDLRPGHEREVPRWRKNSPATPPRAERHTELLIGDGLPDDIAGGLAMDPKAH